MKRTSLWIAAPLIVAGLLLGAALLAACAPAAPDIEGTSWLLTAWSASAQNPADFTIDAAFADGRISGTSAVNSYSGPYTLGADGAFTVGVLVSTRMAGPEPAMQAENIYLGLLAEARSLKLADGTLTLYDEGGNELLIFSPLTY